MSLKTISIDLEAYGLLKAQKRPGESFSKVIKRRLRPTHTAADLLAVLPEATLSEDALDRIEEQIRARRNSPATAPVLDTEE